MIKRKILLVFLSVLLIGGVTQAQKQYGAYCIAFYNVENLFDTVDDPDNPGDDEYTPSGSYAWTPEKYQKKLDNIAYVINKLGKEVTPAGPAIVGLAEVENRVVIEDLVKNKQIADKNYQVVHYDSPDWRGIDVGLIYNPSLFQMTHSAVHVYHHPDKPNMKTRDQLVVSGILAGELVHVIVAHWPSRYGGKGSDNREVAAGIANEIADSLYQIDPAAKVILMGDLNDDPADRSTRVIMNAKRDEKEVKPQGWFNTMWKLHDQGIGSLAYQDKWNLFDQIIVSHALLGKDYSTLKFWKAEVFNRDFLLQKEGKKKGYPLRTFSGTTFLNGYSDHFPTLIYLLKEINR
ncbi:MAG: endonuclease/exonuclease/phosphatase family protein [Bacteroides sp.]|nr:endonuclease/exonuclease/phosphatase family protein [Bacteroides sp.]